MSTKLRIGALISGGGTNLQAILDACAQGAIDGQVVFVGTDNPAAKGLERARRYGVPTFVVDYGRIISAFRTDPTSVKQPPDADLDDLARRQCLLPPGTDPAKIERFLRSRVAAEAALLEAMAAHGLDLLVLAGFMRNLTPYFIDRLNTDPAKPRIMNIHPALLPARPCYRPFPEPTATATRTVTGPRSAAAPCISSITARTAVPSSASVPSRSGRAIPRSTSGKGDWKSSGSSIRRASSFTPRTACGSWSAPTTCPAAGCTGARWWKSQRRG